MGEETGEETLALKPEMDLYYDENQQNITNGYSNMNSNSSLEHKPNFTYSICCENFFARIIQHEGIKSKAMDINFNGSSPSGSKEWALIESFCNRSGPVSATDCHMPMHGITEMNILTLPVYGYVSPCLGIFTLITNILVCVVLLQPHMRNPTNILLVAMAIADLLTGIIPIPVFVHTYTLGYYREWVNCTWAIVNKTLGLNLPTVFHTASIWLTVALAVHRYLCVCHSLRAKQWCTLNNTLIAIAMVYILAFISQLLQYVDSRYEPVVIPSVIEPWKLVKGCFIHSPNFVTKHEDIFYPIYWWFRVVFIHIIPCVSLVILNLFLVNTMTQARKRRAQLLKQNRNSESRKLKESSNTTFMLVAVVAMFLLVEFPLAVIMIMYILQSSLFSHLFNYNQMFQVSTLIINLCILLSYPFNFVIYCGMSRQFRDTFKEIFIHRRSSTKDGRNNHYVSLATENGNNKAYTSQETTC